VHITRENKEKIQTHKLIRLQRYNPSLCFDLTRRKREKFFPEINFIFKSKTKDVKWWREVVDKVFPAFFSRRNECFYFAAFLQLGTEICFSSCIVINKWIQCIVSLLMRGKFYGGFGSFHVEQIEKLNRKLTRIFGIH
jgi:hypothetical protein